MTLDEFNTVSVGDIILCRSGVEVIVLNISENHLHYQKTENAKITYNTHWADFGYTSHILKQPSTTVKSLGIPKAKHD